MSPITPQQCLTSAKTVLKIMLKTTSGIYRLGELFDITLGEPDKLMLINSCEQLDYVGAQMSSGEMVVEGNAGDYFAYKLSGGNLRLNGNAGNYLASAMRNGRLDIYGNVGDYAGAPQAGRMQGQCGGTVIIHGNAGKRLGDRMRRGMMIVSGEVDEYCASRMIAGSIVVLGEIGAHFGIGMRRGSLIVAGNINFSEVDYFSEPIEQEIVFMALMLRHIQTLDSAFESIPLEYQIQRCVGDLTVGGLGEILLIPS